MGLRANLTGLVVVLGRGAGVVGTNTSVNQPKLIMHILLKCYMLYGLCAVKITANDT